MGKPDRTRHRTKEPEFDVVTRIAGQTLPERYSAEAYALWFLDFLRRDLSTLTLGQQLNVRADVWAFANPELVEVDENAGPDWLPPLDAVAALQDESRRGLERVLRGEPGFHLHGIGYAVAKAGDHLVRVNRSGTLQDWFRARAIETLEAVFDRLRACPVCGQTYLKVGKQKYCSRICANRAHWAAYQPTRPERDHHREYVARTRKRVGPKVTIEKRSLK